SAEEHAVEHGGETNLRPMLVDELPPSRAEHVAFRRLGDVASQAKRHRKRVPGGGVNEASTVTGDEGRPAGGRRAAARWERKHADFLANGIGHHVSRGSGVGPDPTS